MTRGRIRVGASVLCAAVALSGPSVPAQPFGGDPGGGDPGGGVSSTATADQTEGVTGPSSTPGLVGVLPEQLVLVPASALAGRTVRDPDGGDAGRLKYLLVDAAGGGVRFALIGASETLALGRQRIAVPFNALRVPLDENDPIQLQVSLALLEAAPRFEEEAIVRLTDPAVAARVIGSFAAPDSVMPDRAESGPPAGSEPLILVGREVITVLAPPTLVSSTDVRGTAVSDPTGHEIGSIDRLMIDPQRGQVAYVLIATGGVLGLGQRWAPVPFQRLSWSAGRHGYTVTLPAWLVQAMATLPRQEEALPVRVSRRELTAFYRRYGVPPYWESGDLATVSAAPPTHREAGPSGASQDAGLGSGASAPVGSGASAPGSPADPVQDQGAALANPEELIGKSVLGEGGAVLGEVEDVILDLDSGLPATLVILIRGAAGAAEKRIAIDFARVQLRTRENVVEVPGLSRDQVASMVPFGYDNGLSSLGRSGATTSSPMASPQPGGQPQQPAVR